jgi:hypothetical protein
LLAFKRVYQVIECVFHQRQLDERGIAPACVKLIIFSIASRQSPKSYAVWFSLE